MPDFTLTLNFNGYAIQDSVSVGDIAYYVLVSQNGGFDINATSIVQIGEITNINRANSTITCSTDLYGNQMPKDTDVAFVLFSKNNCQEGTSLLGYYSMFKFKNNSNEVSEIFNVTVDAFESSK